MRAIWQAGGMRALTDDEWRAYDHVPAEVAVRARVLKVPVLPPGAGAMTIGRFVLVKRDEAGDRTGARELLAHELVHAVQWRQLGFFRFGLRYLGAYVKNLARLRRHRDAYLAIPFEEQARAEAARWEAERAGR